MDGFSLVSLTSTCGTISSRTLSASTEIDELLTQRAVDNASQRELAFLATKLRQFRQHADILETCLGHLPVMSPALQETVSEVLPACDMAVAVMVKEIMRLTPTTPSSNIVSGLVDRFQELLVASSRVFVFVTQLLTMSSAEDQDDKLRTDDAQEMLQKASSACKAVTDSSNILHTNDRTAVDDPSSSSNPGMSESPAYDLSAPPPPFEPSPPSASASASAPASSPVPSNSSVPSSSKSGLAKGFASLTKSFKALTAGMRPKPEPFVVPLCEAAARGNIPQMKGLLGEGANINGRNEDGQTALICAIKAQQVDTVKFLLGIGADLHVRDAGWKGKPPFYHAVEAGSEPIVDLLLASGVNLNERSASGEPFFVQYAPDASAEMVKLLLSRGADVHSRDISGQPLIVKALSKNRIDLIKVLLEHGADPNSKNNTGQAILTLAFNQDRPDLIKLFLSHGASARATLITGVPVVVEAIRQNKLPIAKMLLDHGADPNGRDLVGTPVLVLVMNSTTLSASDKEAAVDMLLSHGANPNESGTWGVSVLMLAVKSSNEKLVKMLLARGASPGQQASSGETPLLYALDHSRWDQVRTLLDHGANPNEADRAGRTPLLVAMQRQRGDLVKVLIQRGANVNQTGQVSPFAIAQLIGDKELMQLLQDHGAQGPAEVVSQPEAARESIAGASGATEGARRPESPPPGYDEAFSKGS